MFSIALAEQELEGYVAEGGKIEDSLVGFVIYVAVRCLFGFGAALAALHDYK